MTKFYCDVCKREMAPDECLRLEVRLGAVTVEVTHKLNETWNSGHVCHGCIKATVAGGKPVKQNAAASV